MEFADCVGPSAVDEDGDEALLFMAPSKWVACGGVVVAGCVEAVVVILGVRCGVLEISMVVRWVFSEWLRGRGSARVVRYAM